MAMVAVGGQTRNVGKTSVICGLIAALRDREWIACKISTHGHSKALEIHEEFDATGSTDSSRYLKAGAVRSFFISVPQEQREDVLAALSLACPGYSNVMVESTSMLEWTTPEISLAVIDPNRGDTKGSMKALARRFDAVVLPAGTVAPEMFGGARMFEIHPPIYCTGDLVSYVAAKLSSTEGR